MEVVIGLNSGAVDGLYVVVLEVFLLGLLFKVVEKLTRLMGKKRVNEVGRLRLISNRWTEVLGRGTTGSGHILRAFVSVVSLTSILMVTFGTNGFTQFRDIPQEEVVYIGKTSDVDAQQRFFLRALNNHTGLEAIWKTLFLPCSKKSVMSVTTYSAFCTTDMCRNAFFSGENTLEEEEFKIFSDHAQANVRCNDGRDGPEVILDKRDKVGFTEQQFAENWRLEYGAESWTKFEASRNRVLFVLEDTIEEGHPLAGVVVTCARLIDPDNEYSAQNCILSIVNDPSEGDGMMFASTSLPEEIDWRVSMASQDIFDLRITIDVNSLMVAHLRDVDDVFLSANHTKWMTTVNIFSVSQLFGALEYFERINRIVQLGEHPTEIEESEATRVENVAVIGLIIVMSTLVISTAALIYFNRVIKKRSYEDVNLLMHDREIYAMMQSQVEGLGNWSGPFAESIDIGVTRKHRDWGILPESDKEGSDPISLKELEREEEEEEMGLKELRRREAEDDEAANHVGVFHLGDGNHHSAEDDS